ncbi:MAG: MFS transporter [Patescibacteria group bacterium]
MRKKLYWSVFFLNFSLALSAYINSLFIESQLGARAVGPAYALVSLLLLFGLALVPELLARAPRRLRLLTNLFLILKIVVCLVLVYAKWPPAILLAFIAFDTLGYLARFNLDLTLEHLTTNRETGRIRGFFLTITNAAWLAAPLLVGTLLGTTEDYAKIYWLVALALIPALYFSATSRKVVTKNLPGQFFPILLKVFRHRNNHYRQIYLVMLADFLLNLFYALMVIYLPLHLHNTLGFAWPTIGLIFTIMLLPFVIVTYPLGWLADKKWGEKEIMALGFTLAGVATLFIPQITSTNLLVWAGILFATRVGAASIEIMKETYLFKKIEAKDIEVLSLSRNLLPLAYLLAPLIGSIVLFYSSTTTIFTALGLITLLGIIPTLALKDTR